MTHLASKSGSIATPNAWSFHQNSSLHCILNFKVCNGVICQQSLINTVLSQLESQEQMALLAHHGAASDQPLPVCSAHHTAHRLHLLWQFLPQLKLTQSHLQLDISVLFPVMPRWEKQV